MKLMDEVAGIVAARHCNTNIVTASVDPINFHRKIKKGKEKKGMKVKDDHDMFLDILLLISISCIPIIGDKETNFNLFIIRIGL